MVRYISPPCERGEGRKAAGGFRAAGDSGPYCHCEERSTRKGYAASVRQQSCQRLRSDVAIRPPSLSLPLGGKVAWRSHDG